MRSLSRPSLAVLSCAALIGCGPAKTSKQAPLDSQVEQPYEEVEIDPTTGVAALAGSWTGNTEIKGYGMAKAVLLLDDQGNGIYSGTLAGSPQNGTFRVQFWDGQYLQAATQGYEERIRGKLVGNQLHLELPYVGSVVLYRAAH